MRWITLKNGQKVPVHKGENFRPNSDPNHKSNESHYRKERIQFIRDFNKLTDEKKIGLLTAKDGGDISKEDATDFLKYSDGTTNDIAKDMFDGGEILANISQKMGYDF